MQIKLLHISIGIYVQLTMTLELLPRLNEQRLSEDDLTREEVVSNPLDVRIGRSGSFYTGKWSI